MVRKLCIVLSVLLRLNLSAQDVCLMGNFVSIGPERFVDRSLEGGGGGLRFFASNGRYCFDVRLSRLGATEVESFYSTSRTVRTTQVSFGSLRSFDMGAKLHLDAGLELTYSMMGLSEEYLSSLRSGEVRSLAFGPALGLRYRVLSIVEPFVAVSSAFAFPIATTDAESFRGEFDPSRNSIGGSWRAGLYITLGE